MNISLILVEYVSHPAVFLKHTTTIFALSHHYFLNRELRVIVDQVQTK